jgi:guanine nucleotide-binding protein G(i) subunit alpha
MGLCASGPEGTKEDTDKSKAIDATLRKDKKSLEKEIKLLLLGAGESGKSTIAKQMKILYLRGFTEAEKRPYKEIIFSNIIMSMRSLVLAVEKFGETFDEENKDCARLFKSNTILFEQTVTPEIADAIRNLWSDPSVKKVFSKANRFQLNDSAG